ncbi:DUF998 domain-containing protein [Nonomuraea aridisoli]|uniref:DUF998 domain-containing protein n=1 Tax=Nonomuraea aridisoli TaxID=2070368 RepID=A0A2W2EM80_9ACTN|nr:DUF998 domain-containing protein [Nonomuraea aridisoli]PZG13528.1 hypothetical protein C1J01_29650 [Nonomuraea aridisoli]
MTPRGCARLSVAATVTAAGALAYAETALPAQVLLSHYALVPGGLAPVIAGMLALAGACVWLAYGLAVTDPVRTAATRVLLLAGAAGLVLSAIFPTDPSGSHLDTVSGEIHRWAAAVVFTSLPVAGWMLARGRTGTPGWNAVRALSVAAGVTLAVYLAAHPASFTSSFVNGGAYYGLLERAVVVADMALIVAMAVTMAGATARLRPAAATESAVRTSETEQQRLAA